MPKVWLIGWLVSMETSLTSEMSHTNEVTSYKREGRPLIKSYSSNATRKIIKQTCCTFRILCVYLLPLKHSPLFCDLLTPSQKALICLRKQPSPIAESGYRKRQGEDISWEI